MEKEKKTIKCSYAVLVIILFAALAFVTDYAFIQNKMNKCSCPDCEIKNNDIKEDTTIVNDNTNGLAQYENVGSSKLSIDFENTNIVAEIVDGDIVMTLSGENVKVYYEDKSMPLTGPETITLNTENAKSLYYITYHEGGNFRLFFITEDNRLYELTTSILSTFGEKLLDEYYKDGIYPKIISDDATQFVGNGRLTREENAAYDLYPEYISVLNTDGKKVNIYFNQTYKYGPYDYDFIK